MLTSLPDFVLVLGHGEYAVIRVELIVAWCHPVSSCRNLPAKSVEEAQRHRQEYEEMVAEAKKRGISTPAIPSTLSVSSLSPPQTCLSSCLTDCLLPVPSELKEAQKKQKMIKERLKQEEGIANAMLVWNNDILPHWDSM